MAWKYGFPVRQEDETEEEYQDRVDAYESAEADYIDDYIERHRE